MKYVNNLADPLTKELSRDMIRKTTSEMRLKPVLKIPVIETQLRINKKLISKFNR